MKSKIKKIKFHKIKFPVLLGVVILFGIIMQSGGGVFQTISLLLCLSTLFFEVCFHNEIKLPIYYLIVYLFVISSISISAIISSLQNVSLGSIISFNFSMYFFIVLYFVAKRKFITVESYITVSCIFSILIIFLAIATFLNISQIALIKEQLIKTFNGIYGPKAFGGIILRIAYFQGTLALIPACIYCLYRKEIFTFLICFFGVFCSGSRFGLIVIFLFYLIFNFRKFLKVLFIGGIITLIGYLSENPIILSIFSIFDDSDGGVSIRSGHLKGIMEVFEYNPKYLIFGQGPGSYFYTYGFHGMTNSCEISQFDFMRKYGLLFSITIFVILLLFSYLLIKNTDKKGQGMGWGLIAHFFVAISNPVLTSLPFMCFLSISITYYYSFLEEKRSKWKIEYVQ